ncbi:MAG: hypothetical protein F4Y14_09775 [Acidobacteria bacterium]|nr:hypothetical protein [Acidobacteriota bacterium]
MDFQVRRRRFRITREDILGAAQHELPHSGDGRNKYFVALRGQPYPIKQVVRLATGLPLAGFTAQDAHRILSRLGFDIAERPGGGSLNAGAPTHADVDLPASPAGPTDEEDANRHGEVLKLLVVFETDEDGWEVASCPTLPGCHSQGRTRVEAVANIREAIRGYLASMREHGTPLPSSSEFQVLEVPG